ncbi:cysteine-rich RLK (RECEPTOR-like protein kinase) 8 [Abeliophyllum distichum]|uniref:Cysteine-rich RLK (RECEPTOR-like protein kinase) 8 n=1 Tax=Abeliophyllum distichum TaxID=126358 RepID=A0ABD1RTR3_9LAMI
MANPGPEHWEALKWLLRYLKGTSNLGLIYGTCNEGVILKDFVDADFVSDKDNRKSTIAYIFTLCGTCISWKSQLQSIVVLSTTESEYVAATEAIKKDADDTMMFFYVDIKVEIVGLNMVMPTISSWGQCVIGFSAKEMIHDSLPDKYLLLLQLAHFG